MIFFKGIFLMLIGEKPKKKSDDLKKLSDEDLIKKIISTKNTLLFSALYDRYGDKVYNKCYSFSKNEDEAKDLTQDVFLKLYVKLGTFKGNSKFSTWLYSFTYNFCVNYVNRDSGRKLSNQSDTIEDHDYHLSTIEDINDEEIYNLKVNKLKIALENIDPEDKAILLLKYQDETSVKELQTLLNLGESAVKMRLKRAKLKVIQAHNNISYE